MITQDAAPDTTYLDALYPVVNDTGLEPAFRALMLGLPSQSDLASEVHKKDVTPDPQKIWQAIEDMRLAQAQRFEGILHDLYANHQVTEAYAPSAEQSGRRALANVALGLISRMDGGQMAQKQYDTADNMTQQLAALGVLLRAEAGEKALQSFEQQWAHDRLVMDKWFGLQVMQAKPADAATTAQALTEHTDFNWKNPNRFRAVMGALAMNHAGFHHENGDSYTLLGGWLLRLDPVNSQTTARMCSAFQTWRRYDTQRQQKIAAVLDRILAAPDLSRDTTEMISRIRGT